MKNVLSYLALFIYAIVFVILLNSNTNANEIDPIGPHQKIMEQLTEQQQKEVKDKWKELWESGASREEIRETIHKMFEEYGVKFPERGEGYRKGRGDRVFHSHKSTVPRVIVA